MNNLKTIPDSKFGGRNLRPPILQKLKDPEMEKILRKLEMLEKKDLELDEKVSLIFDYLKELEQTKKEEVDFKERKRIGFKTK